MKNFVFLCWQIYYETIRKISPGEELLLGPREPIQLDGMNEGDNDVDVDDGDGENENDESKNESGNEETDEEGEDGSVKCIKCDKIFHDIFV